MNKDVVLRIIKYLPKRSLFYATAFSKISTFEILFPSKWNQILLKCNTMPTEKYYRVCEILVKNGCKNLAFHLGEYTTPYKKKRLITYAYKRNKPDVLSLLTDKRFIHDPIVDLVNMHIKSSYLTTSHKSSHYEET